MTGALASSSRAAVFFLLSFALSGAPFDQPQLRLPGLPSQQPQINAGETIQDAIEGKVDMVVMGFPMTDAEIQRALQRRGAHLVHIATAVTAAVPCYNVAGLKAPLNFSAATLAGIFLNRITKWNDPMIAALNPSAHLPAADIIVVGHVVEDGSTFALTDFLSKASPEWSRSIGRVRSFAAIPALVRGSSSEEVAEMVKRTPNSISYTELWAAKGAGLHIGRVRNKAGNYIDPSPVSIAAAAVTESTGVSDDFRMSITDAGGARDYPIATFTWIVIPKAFADSKKASAVLSFLRWVLTDGQNAPEAMYLGRLPRAVADREIRLIDSLH